jgi:hypothetical protein
MKNILAVNPRSVGVFGGRGLVESVGCTGPITVTALPVILDCGCLPCLVPWLSLIYAPGGASLKPL